MRVLLIAALKGCTEEAVAGVTAALWSPAESAPPPAGGGTSVTRRRHSLDPAFLRHEVVRRPRLRSAERRLSGGVTSGQLNNH